MKVGVVLAGLSLAILATVSPVAADGGDDAPPQSSWTTVDGTVAMSGLTTLRGTSADNLAVASVAVTFVDLTGSATSVPAEINSPCSVACAWSVSVPLLLPGPYTAIARATDTAPNLEPGGAAIAIFVV